MILSLIFKDLKAYGRYMLFAIILPAMFWNLVFIYPNFRWMAFIMYSNLAIAATVSYFVFSEKKQSLEVLVASLPVTRTQIVLARYLLVLVILFMGMILFYGNAYLCHLIHGESVVHFEKINHVKNALLSIFLIVVLIGLHYPATFRFGMIGMIFSLVIAVSLSVYLTVQFFSTDSRSWTPYFTMNDWPNLLAIGMGIFLLPLFSIWLSKYIYEKKDL